MNHSDHKNLQTVTEELALLIELRKANERKEQNRTGVLNRSQKRATADGQDRVNRAQQPRLLTGGY